MRAVLALSIALGYCAGIWVILSLPVANLQQVLAAVAWSLAIAARWRLISNAHKRWRRIRIKCDGTVTLQDSHGLWRPASLAKNCIVLSKFAWLNLTAVNGGGCYELMRGDSRESEQWRHLQVIWRHMGRDT
jgi:hypothetical protein